MQAARNLILHRASVCCSFDTQLHSLSGCPAGELLMRISQLTTGILPRCRLTTQSHVLTRSVIHTHLIKRSYSERPAKQRDELLAQAAAAHAPLVAVLLASSAAHLHQWMPAPLPGRRRLSLRRRRQS